MKLQSLSFFSDYVFITTTSLWNGYFWTFLFPSSNLHVSFNFWKSFLSCIFSSNGRFSFPFQVIRKFCLYDEVRTLFKSRSLFLLNTDSSTLATESLSRTSFQALENEPATESASRTCFRLLDNEPKFNYVGTVLATECDMACGWSVLETARRWFVDPLAPWRQNTSPHAHFSQCCQCRTLLTMTPTCLWLKTCLGRVAHLRALRGDHLSMCLTHVPSFCSTPPASTTTALPVTGNQ